MKQGTIFSFLLITLIIIPMFGTVLFSLSIRAEEIKVDSSEVGLIRIAVTENVAPRNDWSNGTLYHLKILKKFIPVKSTLIQSLSELENFDVLILNMLNISEADMATITKWVSNGGFLICIGQSGRYTEIGEERYSHPLSETLGVTLDSWERTDGMEVRKIVTSVDWHWWGSGRQYDTANNGDGLYHEMADLLYVPKSECVNITLNGATEKMSCRDQNNTYEEPFLTSNIYGAGRAFLIAADLFYRIVWRPPSEDLGLFDTLTNIMPAGFWFRSGLLWQMLFAILLDCYQDSSLPIISTMPDGFYAATSFAFKVVGGSAEDQGDEEAYQYLIQEWKPQVLDEYPQLKGNFWGFWILTGIIDGTSNATNIVNFVEDYGYAGSRSHTGEWNNIWSLSDYIESQETLISYGVDYEIEGSCGSSMGYGTVASLVKDFGFQKIFYHRRTSGEAEHGAEISVIPYPIVDNLGQVKFFVSPYVYADKWKLLVEKQRTLGENYGIGGFCMGNTYIGWLGDVSLINEAIYSFIDDEKVWKTDSPHFIDWWDKRWNINITDYHANSSQLTFDLQTPDIEGLTVLLTGDRKDVSLITVDGIPISDSLEFGRLVIPQLNSGKHKVVVKFMFSSNQLKEYNDNLRDNGNPFIGHSTQMIKNLNFTQQSLSLTFDFSTNTSAELKVVSSHSPLKVFVEGNLVDFKYDQNVAEILISSPEVQIFFAQPNILHFTSSKNEYELGEDVILTLETFGEVPNYEIINWIARVTVLNKDQNIIGVINQEIELGMATTEITHFTIRDLTVGAYTIIVEILHPFSKNIFAKDNLIVNFTEKSITPLIFKNTSLRDYNEELKINGLPYVEGSTQIISDLDFSRSYQRLTLILDVYSGINTELMIAFPFSPLQVLVNQRFTDFTYDGSVATILTSASRVDIYYALPEIIELVSTNQRYEPDEEVKLNLRVYGDYPTTVLLKWIFRFTIEDNSSRVVKTLYEEVELDPTQNLVSQFVMGRFPLGDYKITAEIVDPDTDVVLEKQFLILDVTRTRTKTPPSHPSLIPIIIILTSITLAIAAISFYYFKSRKKD